MSVSFAADVGLVVVVVVVVDGFDALIVDDDDDDDDFIDFVYCGVDVDAVAIGFHNDQYVDDLVCDFVDVDVRVDEF